ncbi:MAG: hypothetical protein ACOH1V_02420 [Stenotrophomonas sp.]
MNVTVRQRAQVAMRGHSHATGKFHASIAAGRYADACLWKDTAAACLDEIDECAWALDNGMEPPAGEILKNNADLQP